MFHYLNDVDDNPYMMWVLVLLKLQIFEDYKINNLCFQKHFMTINDMHYVHHRDPFAAHRHQMRSLFGSFGMDPFPLTPQIQHPRTRIQVPIRATKTGPGLNILSKNDHVNTLTISWMLICHLWWQFVSIVLLGVMGDYLYFLFFN